MQGNTLLAMFPNAAEKGFPDRLVNVLQTVTMQKYEHHFSDDGVDLWAKVTMVRQGNDVLTIFQWLHNRSEYQGTGIGLAIVQKVVEHRYIEVDERPDQGATFRILLPYSSN